MAKGKTKKGKSEKPRNIKTAKSARAKKTKSTEKRSGNYGAKYTPAKRKEIVAYAKKKGVAAAAKRYKATPPSIYRWKRERKAA